MLSYAFWNNKGGTGKTSLAFQTICAYAYANKQKRILAIDVCPQSNLSELLLGGLEGRGSDNLLKIHGQTTRASIGGIFRRDWRIHIISQPLQLIILLQNLMSIM